MFCKNCGKQIEEDTRFCPHCGSDVAGNTTKTTELEKVNAEEVNKSTYAEGKAENSSNQLKVTATELPDKYLWALAIVPIAVLCLIVLLFGTVWDYAFVILNCFFIYMDRKMLKESGTDLPKWLWLGVIVPPIYLFVRAKNGNKKYSYCIIWFIIFLFYGFIVDPYV